MRLTPALVFGSTLALLCQLPGQVDAGEAARELAKVFERPAGTTIVPDVALPRLKEFLARHEGKDLGALSYARALEAWLERNPARAVEEQLDAFFAKHADIGDEEHRKMAGRIYLMAVAAEGREETPDEERLRRSAERAARLYRPSAGSLCQVIKTAVAKDKVTAKCRADVLASVATIVLASEQTADAKVTALEQLFGDPAARNAPATPAAGRAAAAPGKLEFPPTKAMSGKTISLDDHKGKVVLIDFWATWCGPCMTEMPNVVALHDKFHEQGLEIIGVSLDRAGAEAAIAGAEKKFAMKWEQVYDGGHWQAALAVQNGIRGIPAVFVVDRTGKVRHTPTERLRGASLEKAIAALIAEKTPD